MKLTKANVRKIQLKTRNYKCSKDLTDTYICELDVVDDLQVIRIFHCNARLGCLEIQRGFFNESGEDLLMSYGAYMNHYCYRLNYDSNFDFRWQRRIHYYVHKLVIKNVLPQIKKYVIQYLKKNTDIYDYIKFVLQESKNENVESVASVNLKNFIDMFNGQHSNYAVIRACDKYKRSLQLIAKWGYKVKNWHSYIDHLDLVKELGFDLRNAKYIAPKDFNKAHAELSRKKDEYISAEKEKAYAEKINKYKLKEFYFENDNIYIKPLITVKQVREEGKEQHHCVFSKEYYQKKDTLLFTSFAKSTNEKLETIEFNLDDKFVVQSRGKYNEPTDLHDCIVSCCNVAVRKHLYMNQLL